MNNNPCWRRALYRLRSSLSLGALQTQASVPTLSATEHNEVIHKKLRILRGAGIWIFSILAGMGGFAFLYLMILSLLGHVHLGAMITINSPIHVGYLPLYPNVARVWGLVALAASSCVYYSLWMFIFRRFTPEKLLTERTGQLIIASVLAMLSLWLLTELVFFEDPSFSTALAGGKLSVQKTTKLAHFLNLTVNLTGVIPEMLQFLALGWAIKLSASFKQENDLTV